MYEYNVTFINTDWHMTTTVECEHDPMGNDDKIADIADYVILDNCGFSPMAYANVDIDVEYVGYINV